LEIRDGCNPIIQFCELHDGKHRHVMEWLQQIPKVIKPVDIEALGWSEAQLAAEDRELMVTSPLCREIDEHGPIVIIGEDKPTPTPKPAEVVAPVSTVREVSAEVHSGPEQGRVEMKKNQYEMRERDEAARANATEQTPAKEKEEQPSKSKKKTKQVSSHKKTAKKGDDRKSSSSSSDDETSSITISGGMSDSDSDDDDDDVEETESSESSSVSDDDVISPGSTDENPGKKKKSGSRKDSSHKRTNDKAKSKKKAKSLSKP